MENSSEMIIYQTEDGKTQVNLKALDGTVWLTQEAIAELFGVKRPAITKHLKNIFDYGELSEQVVCSILEHTMKHGAIEGKTQTQRVKYYNLDAILAVGYHVKSPRGVQFRKWLSAFIRWWSVVRNNRTAGMLCVLSCHCEPSLSWRGNLSRKVM
jgi:hypothetical protein